MKNFPSHEELSALLETQLWAIYNPHTRLFSNNGNWADTPHFFPDEKTARIVHGFLNPKDTKNTIVIGFSVSPTQGVVPEESTVPNIIEEYIAQRQARTIRQQLSESATSSVKRTKKI